MKEIKTVGIVGLGALGVLYARQFTDALGPEQVRVLADAGRIARYRSEGVFFNDALCNFHYADAALETQPPDLMLFAVKFGALEQAIAQCRHLVGPDTTILSVLNGISSEQILSAAFGPEKVVWCVAQKMSALKEGNRAVCRVTGNLAVGVPAGQDPSRLQALRAFFDRIGFAYETPEDIRRHMWSKLLVNVGCNQSAMVHECTYAGLQAPGRARNVMIGAMREVALVANAEGIPLSEEDVSHWTAVVDSLDPDSTPSMRQDSKARRKSEVELFAGTVRRLAQKHGIAVPVNDWLYEMIREMESCY